MRAAYNQNRSEGRSGQPGRRSLRLDALEPRVLLSAAPGLETLVDSGVGSPVSDSGILLTDTSPPALTMAAAGAAAPSVHDQLMLELLNRARANPDAEAARFGIDLNEGIAPGTISSTPKQPLAFNPFIIDAAQKHSQWMLDTDTFDHIGAGGSSPFDRMEAAGYVFVPSWGWGENIAWQGITIIQPDVTQYTIDMHDDLFIDVTQPGRGHRLNMMKDDFREIGIGVVPGVFTTSLDYNAVMATQDFAYVAGSSFLTGVAYDDAVTDDDFYTVGEALGGVTIVATREGTGTQYATTSWGSGGYTLQLPAGTYDIEASGGGLGGTALVTDVVIGSQNVKVDFTPDMVAPADTVGPRVTDVSVDAVASPFVGVDGTGFTLDGGPFYTAGTNTYYLMAFAANPAARGYVDEIFADAAAMGLTTMRTWGFWEPDPDMPGDALQMEPGVYNEATFVGLDYVVDRAADYGIRLIIPFVNYWPDYGGMDAYVAWDATYGTGGTTATERNDFYTDSDTRAWYQNHVAEVINRVNTFNGIAYKNDPTIMAWELANEPRAEGDYSANTLQTWIEEMATYIKSIDANHLLSTGAEGFYDNRPGGWMYNGSNGADFIRNHNVPEIDFATVHVWPQNWDIDNEAALDWVDAHIIDAHTTLGKPLLIEEFGQFRDGGAGDSGPSPLRNELYEGIFDLAEANDVAGWNFWILYHDAYGDYDSYGVYYPADADTVGLIVRAADALNQKTRPAAAASPLTSLTATFDEPLDPAAAVAANARLVRSGGDRRFGDATDLAVVPDTVALSPDGLTITLTFAETLPDDLYRLTLDGTASLADPAGNRLDGEYYGALPSGDGNVGGDFVAFFTVETLAAPGGLDVDTDHYAAGSLNPTGPAPHSLGFVGLDANGNPAHRVYALRVGDDASPRWLALDGDVLEATGAAAEWHTAAFWANARLRGLDAGTAHAFYAKARDAAGAETGLVAVGTYATNVAGDVNGSGVATALDYAYIRAAILRGDVFGGTWRWSADADDSGVLDGGDLAEARDRVLNPPLPPPPAAAPSAAVLAPAAAPSPAVLAPAAAPSPAVLAPAVAPSAAVLAPAAAPSPAVLAHAVAPSAAVLAAAARSAVEPSGLLASTAWQAPVLRRARPARVSTWSAEPWTPPRLDDPDQAE